MKEIINGKLYDTEKATLVFDTFITKNGRLLVTSYYITKNLNWFTCNESVGIQVIDENEIGRVNPDLYIILFGEVEEA